MERRKLFYYLLLNVLVSALTTAGILFWYDRAYRAGLPAVAPLGAESASPQKALDPQTDIPVKISSVVAAGALESEVVIIKFDGDGQLNLSAWQLKDEDGNTFTFPNVTLYPNGAVQVHTLPGADTIIDLYWGLGAPVWNSGENAQLLDSQGNLRAAYQVP
ncbi:MAG: hypothetical protein Fur002_25790 [Anaerolineales bacterium]